MGTTNILDLNNRVTNLKRAVAENFVVTLDKEKEIYSVMGKMGAKNLIAYPYFQSTITTPAGITFTDNGDGTITADGTATADTTFTLHSRTVGEKNEFVVPNGRYILSGCPIGGSATKYELRVGITKNNTYYSYGSDMGEGVEFVADGDDFDANCVNLQIQIGIMLGQTVSNLTFKPMLRLASDTDDTYQPYAKTNKQLMCEIANKVPDAPTADGTYNLSATVASGVPTYSWISTS